ncbi:MAG: diguanylate cyclase [Rhodocyclaceae bacterium]|nr:diguanylate cyclase [Rhodocyclaceae bacterium]
MNDRYFADLSLELNRHIVNLLDSLSALSALAQLSIDQLDEATLTKRALAALMANQDMERCSIFLIDEEDMLACAAGLDWNEMLKGEPAATAAPSRPASRYPRTAGLMGEAASTGQLIHCASCAEDERFRQLGAQPVVGSLMCIPIACDGKVLGVLNVFHPTPGFFNLWHERLTLLFCQSFGRVLTSHRLARHLNAQVAAKTAELLRQQEFLQSVLDGAPNPIMVIGRDYRILTANRAARALAGEAGAAHCYELSHHRRSPCEGEAHRCPLREVMESGQTVEVMHEHFDAHGAPLPVDLASAPLFDRHGTIIGIIESARDITERQRIEATLRQLSRRLEEAQRIAHIGSWERDFATDRMSCSAEMKRILGPARCVHCADCRFPVFVAAIHPEDRDAFMSAYSAALAQHRPFEFRHRLLREDGEIVYVHTHGETLYDKAGQPLTTLGTMQDVTLAVLTEMSLKESEERFRTIADYTYDWEYWEGPGGEILYCSPSCVELTGYAVHEFVAQPNLLYDIIHPEDRPQMAAHRADIGLEHTGAIDFRIIRKDGALRWIAHGCRAVRGRDGRFMGRRASNCDITELKEAEARIRQLAYYDTLTGLPNRRLLLDRLTHALAQAKRFGRSMAVMFLDLDRFKQINDTLGHAAGDDLLKQVAGRLTGCVRAGDTVARPGGDEFVIVLTEVSHPEDAARVAEKILAAFAAPVIIAGQPWPITTSIGIAGYPVNGPDDVEELMKKADMAMSAAKEAGRNTWRFFTP